MGIEEIKESWRALFEEVPGMRISVRRRTLKKLIEDGADPVAAGIRRRVLEADTDRVVLTEEQARSLMDYERPQVGAADKPAKRAGKPAGVPGPPPADLAD